MPRWIAALVVLSVAQTASASDRSLVDDLEPPSRARFAAINVLAGVGLVSLTMVPEVFFENPENDAPFMLTTYAVYALPVLDMLLAEYLNHPRHCLWYALSWAVGVGTGVLLALAMPDLTSPTRVAVPCLAGTVAMQLTVAFGPRSDSVR